MRKEVFPPKHIGLIDCNTLVAFAYDIPHLVKRLKAEAIALLRLWNEENGSGKNDSCRVSFESRLESARESISKAFAMSF